MADILIRGMEMPKSCFDCIFENRFFGKIGCNNLPGMFANELQAIAYTTERNPFCPLVPLPEWHGRCIEADALLSVLDILKDKGCDGPVWDQMRDIVESMVTIIPAEGGADNG